MQLQKDTVIIEISSYQLLEDLEGIACNRVIYVV